MGRVTFGGGVARSILSGYGRVARGKGEVPGQLLRQAFCGFKQEWSQDKSIARASDWKVRRARNGSRGNDIVR